MMCNLAQETVDEILSIGSIYEVGGAVRDKLLSNSSSKDKDYLVTGVPYDKLSKLLKRYGSVDLVGKSFGVIKFTRFDTKNPFTCDIALPRKEFSTGLAHRDFSVEYDPEISVEEDLTRRDFTVNAMAISLKDQSLIDPLGGQIDLESRKIRMTSENSFEEDPLRMLRAIQFSARFNFEIEDETKKSLIKNAELINTVSVERIAEELNKLLEKSEKPSIGFFLMQETGLLEHIIPELELCVGVDQPGGFHKYNVFEHILYTIDACKQNLRLRLSALFHDIRKPQAKRVVENGATFYGHETYGAKTAKAVLSRLKFSNEMIKDVSVLVDRHMFTTDVTDKGLRRLIRRVGVDLIFDLLDLRRADVVAQGMGGTTEDVDECEQRIKNEINRKSPFSVKDLVLDGKDIMFLRNIKEGPEIGIVLDHLMEVVLDDPSQNKKEILESIVNNFDLSNYKRKDNSGNKL